MNLLSDLQELKEHIKRLEANQKTIPKKNIKPRILSSGCCFIERREPLQLLDGMYREIEEFYEFVIHSQEKIINKKKKWYQL